MLTLFEEFFLLSIDDENGSPLPSVADNLGYGLSGALLAELSLQGKVRVSDTHRLELVDSAKTGDEMLDEALGQVQESSQVRKVTYWVKHFSDEPKKLRKRLVERLETGGVVKQEDNRLSWVTPYADSQEKYASAKYLLKSRLRQNVLAGEELELHDLVLLNLVKACGMLNLVFTRDERKMGRRRIYELMVAKSLSNPLVQSIQEIEAAVESQTEAD
jgi:hypothetical protein